MNPFVAGRSMHLHLEGESTPAGHLRRCRVERMTDGRVESAGTVWFELPREIEPPPVGDAEPFLMCLLLEAMQEGRTLVAHGRVSPTLLSNLTEYRDAWCNWSRICEKGHFHRIEFGADEIRPGEPAPGPDLAVMAFSGGVDSSFTLWRHHHRQAGHRTVKISGCVMAHGFDFPLSKPDVFEPNFQRNRQLLAPLGYVLHRVRTNFREESRVDWGVVAHGAAIVATLAFFKRACRTILLASSYPYRSPRLPWGSSSLTDHLLAGDGWRVLLDGAGFTRTEKVAGIQDWMATGRPLRVCFQADPDAENCGRCEKCVRTAANFLACGLPIPRDLGQLSAAGVADLIPRLLIADSVLNHEWRPILDHADEAGIEGRWVAALRRRIRHRIMRRGAGMLLKGR